MPPKTTTDIIPSINWGAHDSALVWALIAEMKKHENFKVLFGKIDKDENTSGETKISVCRRIGEVLLPHLYPDNAKVGGERIRNKISDLQGLYKKHSKKLRQTGGGLGGDSQGSQETAEGGGDQYLDFYIHPDGPDHDTSPLARNLWESITRECPFFPALHAIFSTRANTVPIAVTTGIGPAGPQTLHLQAPQTPPDAPDGGAAPALQAPPAAPAPPSAASSSPSSSPVAPPEGSVIAPVDAVAVPPAAEEAPAAPPRAFGTPISVNQTPQRAPGAPRPSTNLIESAKAKITKLPAKRSFEEDGIELIKFQINAANRREMADRIVKKRKLLMEEFKMDIWTKEEYRLKVDALEAEAAKGNKENALPTSSRLHGASSSSSILSMSSSSDTERD